MSRPRNIVGPQIRALRERAEMTQAAFVGKLQAAGWSISRETLAKIEAQIRWVADFELVHIADVLNVPVTSLFPGRAEKKARELLESGNPL